MPGAPVHYVGPESGEILRDGEKIVTVAGTPESLILTSAACIEVLIQVKATNTGNIYVGGSTVPNNGTSGITIAAPTAGQTPPSMPISAQNLNQIYINSDSSGDGVNFIYW